MIRRILIPTDGFGLEDHVINYVARAFPFAEFHVISVVNTYEKGVQLTNLLYNEIKEASQKAVCEAEKKLTELGVSDVKTMVIEGLPSKEIVKYAKINDIDLIAMRVYGRKQTASAHRIGSTVRNVLKKSRIPVLTLSYECDRIPIKSVLLLTDGTNKTKRAENFAILFASSYNLELETMYFLFGEGEDTKHVERIVKSIGWRAQFWNVPVKKSIIETDIKNIFKHFNENDIVVMGVGKKTILGCKIGHLSLYVASHSPIPVIFVRKMKERWFKRISHK